MSSGRKWEFMACRLSGTLLHCPQKRADILLAAHSMGLGSCLIGMAVEAMKRDGRIQHAMGIPRDETAYAIIALGYSVEIYQRPAGRKKPTGRYFKS